MLKPNDSKKYRLLPLLILFGLFFLNPNLFAQNQVRVGATERPYAVKKWDNSNSLPQNSIQAIGHDLHFYTWIATEEGITRFDGQFMKTFNKTNTPSLFSHTIYGFALQGDKGLWAFTEKGLILLNKTVINAYDFSQELKNSYIRGLAIDTAGNKWFITSDNKLMKWDEKALHLVEYAIPDKGEWRNIQYNNANLYIGTTQGLYAFSLENEESKLIFGTESLEIQNLFADKNGVLFGTKKRGLFQINDLGEAQRLTPENSLKDNYIVSIGRQQSGRIWFSTFSDGVFIIEENGIEKVKIPDYDNELVQTILCQGTHVVLGTIGAGGFHLKPANIKNLAIDLKLSGRNIGPIFQDESGDIWTGVSNYGVDRVSPELSVSNFSIEEGLPTNTISTIGGKDDLVFFGSPFGLTIIDSKKNKLMGNLGKNDGLKDNYVQTIFKSSRGTVYVTTLNGGVHILQDDLSLQALTFVNNSYYEFPTIYETKNGDILIGTDQKQILRFRNNEFVETLTIPETFPAYLVLSLFEDPKETLWIGTDEGLFAYQNNTFTHFSKENGLVSNNIFSLTDDKLGHIWMSSNHGLQTIPIEELDRLLNDPDGLQMFFSRTFRNEHGMPNTEANGGIFPASFTMDNGTTWFPTIEGVAIAVPEYLVSDKRPINIEFESVVIKGQEQLTFEDVRIPADGNDFYVNYNIVDYEDPGRTFFNYRIKEIDKNWKSAEDRRSLYFNYLKPGTYTFELQAFRNGRASEVESFTFVVESFFYQTLWFTILISTLVFGAGIISKKYYDKHQNQKQLEKLVHERTFELQKSKELLESALEDIEYQNRKLIEITWMQSHTVRAPLTKALGINNLLINYENYTHVKKSKEDLKKELQECLINLDEVVRNIHEKSEKI